MTESPHFTGQLVAGRGVGLIDGSGLPARLDEADLGRELLDRVADKSILRGSVVRLFRRACAEGRLDFAEALHAGAKIASSELRYAPQVGEEKGRTAVALCCAGGHLDVLEWLAGEFGLTEYDLAENGCWAFVAACGGGYSELAQWIVRNFAFARSDIANGNFAAFREACANGQIDTAEWLADYTRMTKAQAISDNNDAFVRACSVKRKSSLITGWLTKRFGLLPVDTAAQNYQGFVDACEAGERDTAERLLSSWLHEASPAFGSLRDAVVAALRVAAKTGDAALLDWLLTTADEVAEMGKNGLLSRLWPAKGRDEHADLRGTGRALRSPAAT